MLWTRLAIGRWHALTGNVPKACKEGFDRVLGIDTYGLYTYDLYGAPLNWVQDLRMTAFLWKAEAAFEAGNYELCARTVDRMLAPFVG